MPRLGYLSQHASEISPSKLLTIYQYSSLNTEQAALPKELHKLYREIFLRF
jgi:hypothetical protein